MGFGVALEDGRPVDLRDWRGFAGPVARAYELSRAPVAMIVGPTGGGKTTASSRRCLRVARWQHASPRDGVRRARICCLCPTYRRAWDTVIPSFFKSYPKTSDNFRGARGDPADYFYGTNLIIDGRPAPAYVEVLFRAVTADTDIEDFFRGLEVTAFWLPEADTNADLSTILSLASNRVGRYPEPDDRPDNAPDAYKGVFGDANAPVIGSPFHDRFYLKRMPDKKAAPGTDQLFIQPSGFSANAENLHNLRKISRNFYEDQRAQLDKYDVDRMLANKPGPGRHGKAVHPNFDYERHVAKREIAVDPYSPVYIGIDAGSNTLHPGAVFYQKAYSSQWRAMAEIHVAEGQMNNDDFADRIREVYNFRFGAVLTRDNGALLCIDPAAGSPNAHTENSASTAMELQAKTGIEVMLAPSNKLAHRRGALDKLFLGSVSGSEPAILIDPVHCPGFIEGLSGGFHYRVTAQGVSPTPAKTVHSHVCEAGEYAPLTIDGLDAREGRFIRPGGEAADSPPVAIYAD